MRNSKTHASDSNEFRDIPTRKYLSFSRENTHPTEQLYVTVDQGWAPWKDPAQPQSSRQTVSAEGVCLMAPPGSCRKYNVFTQNVFDRQQRCAGLAIMLLTAIHAAAADWPQFRGPHGDGRSESRNLPETWGGLLRPAAWQTGTPGQGWSSPVVVGQRIWLTAAEQTALTVDQLQKKLAGSPYGVEDFQTHATVTLLAVEFDATNGKLLRTLELFNSEDPAPIHAMNSYASPTPVTDGERLYCHFGSLGTACVELASGKVLWKQRFVFDEITGPGNSPVLCNDRLILACDGADQQFVVGLDPSTGKELWRTQRPAIVVPDDKLKRSFSTPLVVSQAGRTQVIAPAAQWVVSYNPANGEEWWRAKITEGHALVPRPVFQDGVVFVCSGYPKPELWAIRTDGSGDVSETHVKWSYSRQVPEISSPVIFQDHIYFVSRMGVATSLRISDGSLVWQQRLDGNYSASLLAADGKIFFTSEEGLTTVIQPGARYEELYQNQLFGRTLASLAIAGESLLIRTDNGLYCVSKKAPQTLANPLGLP